MKQIDIYVGELEIQIEFTKVCYRNYEKSYAENDIPKTFMNIHHFLIHISNIDKILDLENNQFRKSIFEGKLNIVDLKQFRRLRNHLEHFDERLDKWIKEYDGNTFFDMNFVQGTKGFPQKSFLRALDGKIMKFLGEDYDLELLINLVAQLEEDLKKLEK